MAITDAHAAFARAVVALAREHQMDRISLEFEANFDPQREAEFHSWGKVSMYWREPREGEDTFQLKAEQRANFPAKDRPNDRT
ncbi:MAG: hypothetical protein ACPGFA_01190 [Pikeienuella sp.]